MSDSQPPPAPMLPACKPLGGSSPVKSNVPYIQPTSEWTGRGCCGLTMRFLEMRREEQDRWPEAGRGEEGVKMEKKKNVQTEKQRLSPCFWPVTAFLADQGFPRTAHRPHPKGAAQKTNRTPTTVHGHVPNTCESQAPRRWHLRISSS